MQPFNEQSGELWENYNNTEEDLTTAERLLAAERRRVAGTKGYSVDDFERNMHLAIKSGTGAYD